MFGKINIISVRLQWCSSLEVDAIAVVVVNGERNGRADARKVFVRRRNVDRLSRWSVGTTTIARI